MTHYSFFDVMSDVIVDWASFNVLLHTGKSYLVIGTEKTTVSVYPISKDIVLHLLS